MGTPDEENTDPPAIRRTRNRHKLQSSEKARRYLLDQEKRETLYQQITRTPGLNMRLLAQATGIPESTTRYHMERFEAYEVLIVFVKPNEVVCFRSQDAHLFSDRQTRILYGGEHARQVARYITQNAGATINEMADAFEKSYGAINNQVKRLLENELIHRTRPGRSYRHEPTSRLRTWEREVGIRFPPPPPGEPVQDEEMP